MKCVICKNGQTKEGTTTLTLERGPTTIVFKGIPARVCDVCGEAYVDEATTEDIMKIAEKAVEEGVQVDIRYYKAA